MKWAKRWSWAGLLVIAAWSVVAPAFGQASPVQPFAAQMAAEAGWVVLPTGQSFPELSRRLEAAVAAHGMVLVNSASASEGARALGLSIPGNRVIGVFRNDYARRLLAVSLPAGIEAPIRYYLTENGDGSATLSYRTPHAVLSRYMDGAGPDLEALATELDTIFLAIAVEAVQIGEKPGAVRKVTP
jgi:uncharacterized protein (DUF302 family)